jgi:hypothetical protein
MTWEQRWMRRILRGIAWAVVFLTTAALLDVSPDWKTIVLVIVSSIAFDVFEALLPINDGKPKVAP